MNVCVYVCMYVCVCVYVCVCMYFFIKHAPSPGSDTTYYNVTSVCMYVCMKV